MNIAELNIPEEILKEIQSIKREDTIEATIPIGVYLQDAEIFVLWAKDDLKELSKVGITNKHIEELQLRIDICRKVQTCWIHYKDTQSELDKRWKNDLQAGKDLKSEMLHYFTYAFRHNKDLQKILKYIRKGNTHADLVQDLANLTALGEANTELLEKVSFDHSILDKASELCPELGLLAGQYNGNKVRIREHKEFRDKTYTYLKQCLDEIRNAGKFVFRNNKKRLRGYMIAYYLKKKASLNPEK
jgi:hypothetical protein